MVFGDLMGFSDSDYAYNQQRAHSAEIFIIKLRAWLWGGAAALTTFFLGNILGVFDINVLGWLIDTFWHSWEV